MALGANGEEERSLRDDLAAELKAIEEREASQATAAPKDEEAAASEAEAKVEPTETKADRGDGRDAHGRFAKKDGVEDQNRTAPTDELRPEAPALAQGEPTPAAASPQQTEDAPPKSWRSDEAQAWKDLPATAKSAILRREAEAARLAGANDGERMFGREMAEIFRPHVQEIQAAGASPQQALKILLDNHNALRSNDMNVKVAKARELMASYGIDPSLVAQPDPNAPSDPFVYRLQQEIAQLKSRLGPQGQPAQFAPLPPSPEEYNVQSEIEAFRSDPAHPHFDAVHQRMGQLLEAGAAPDLESAYHAAVAMDPALRSTVAVQAPQRTQEEKTAAARRASASVTGSPGIPGNPKPMSLRDELREQMRSAGFPV
jgi:hypothetical protein